MTVQSVPSVKLEDKYKDLLVEIDTRQDIPEEWQNGPVGAFITAQNFSYPINTTDKPQVLIVTCIDFRFAMTVPKLFSYVIRRAAGRVAGSEFSVGYCMAKGVKDLVLVGHNDCGMTKVPEHAPKLLEAYLAQGWSKEAAEKFIQKHGPKHAIKDELEALQDEYMRLVKVFPKLNIAPLFVNLYDSKLHLPRWYLTERVLPTDGPASVPDDLIDRLP